MSREFTPVWEGPHRYVCTVIDELRALNKKVNLWTYHRNRATFALLLEELQTYVNRMEAALDYQKDIVQLHDERKALFKEIKDLRQNEAQDED